MTVQLDEFKTRQRAAWGAGDYAALSEHIADVGELVVARARVEPGTIVLDVACGTGNAAFPVPQATSSTIVPGSTRARATTSSPTSAMCSDSAA